MRKTTILFIAIVMASINVFAADMTGTYKVGTTSGADYASLSAAINALNAATITGDVVFEITSDITEAANFGLGKDMGSFKLTIRPDADADRAITFTQATGNTGPYGHFVIGCATANLGTALSDATVVATNNVTIDGYAIGGTTKRLKLTTSSDALAGSVIINIVGGTANTTIKNAIIENQATGSNPRCIYITQFKGTTLNVSPSNILIENNTIKSVPSLSTINGIGIQCTKSGTPTNWIENLDIKNNIITTSGNGIEINYANGADIMGNEFKVQKQTGTGISSAIWFRGKNGNMNVIGNKFLESSLLAVSGTVSNYTVSSSANASNPFNLNIFNNTFSGMKRTTTGATALNQTYIADAGYGTTKVYNNSFYLPALNQPSQAGYYHAFKFTGTNKMADIQNNIFISNEDAKSVLISDPITTGTMNNNIYYLRAGNTNAKVVGTYATLADFKTANPTLDVNSKSVDVNFVDAEVGNLLLTGASIQDINLKVPSLASVTTDILGTTRNTQFTYAGAHEAALPFLSNGFNKAILQASLEITKNGIFIPANGTSIIELYTLNGTLVDKAITNNSYSRALSNGAYIVKINGKAVKFVK